MYYYELHVFYSRSEGYSIGLQSETQLSDDDAINLATKRDLFPEQGDGDYVDSVDEMTEKEYKEIFGES